MTENATKRTVFIVAAVWPTGLVTSSGQIPDCPAWEQQHPLDTPSPRWGHAMAYDSARKVTVLFGGRGFTDGEDHYFGDTWEWDGHTWTLRSTIGPPPRYQAAIAYDDSRRVAVLFGGVDGEFFGDTWEWDGIAWVRRGESGPPPRWQHALSYDSNRRVTVLFGGLERTTMCLGGTWEWDGSTWDLRSNTGPAPRFGHGMAYDAKRHVTVLNGGITGPVAPSGPTETWEWDGGSWKRRAWGDPMFRAGHVMAFDSAAGVTLLFSGSSSAEGVFQTWAWDGTLWALLSNMGPPARVNAAMAYDSDRAVAVLFGGLTGPAYLPAEDTWELPSCPADSDGDGFIDSDDDCDSSDLSSLIIIAGCESGVANQLFDNGCTMMDGIRECSDGGENHGQVISCVVARLTNEWASNGVISGQEKGSIQRCAGQADLPAKTDRHRLSSVKDANTPSRGVITKE